MRLKGKKCIVTGGSSGIGEATVRRFISEGAEVLIADINLEDSKKLSEEIGEGVDYIKCDVRLEDDIISVSEKAYEMWDHDPTFHKLFLKQK